MLTHPMRPLRADEEALLRQVLERVAPSYLPQLSGLRARNSCSCGCPSITLLVAEEAPPGAPARERILVDLCGQTAEGLSVGLLIFQDAGRLSELEVYPYDNEGRFGLPTIESLLPFQAGTEIS